MPDVPFPLTSSQLEELKPQINDMLRDIYENKVGGCLLGDVFQISGDTFELKIKSGCGLQKTDGELDFDKSVIGTTASSITNVPSGTISSTNVQAAINELDSEKLANGASPSFPNVGLQVGVADPGFTAGLAEIWVDSEYNVIVNFNYAGGTGRIIQFVEP